VIILPAYFLVALMLLHFSDSLPVFCFFRRATGIPCPTCGAFRALEYGVRGHIVQAWFMQPLMTTLAALGILFVVYSWIVVLLRLPRVRLGKKPKRFGFLVTLLFLLATAANWVYLVLQAR